MSQTPIIYLSPAVHAKKRVCQNGVLVDRAIAAYLDELCRYLTACGFGWQRNATDMVGAAGVQRAVAASNACGAALHYAVRTAQADGKKQGSVLLASPSQAEWAAALARQREAVSSRAVRVCLCRDMYEMVYATAPCLYDYLGYHDNAEDTHRLCVHWRELAAATARALCEIFCHKFHVPGA